MPAVSAPTRPRHVSSEAGNSKVNVSPSRKPSRLPWKPSLGSSGAAAPTAIARRGSRNRTDVAFLGCDVTTTAGGALVALTTASTGEQGFEGENIVPATQSGRDSVKPSPPSCSTSSISSTSSDRCESTAADGGLTRSRVSLTTLHSPEVEEYARARRSLTGSSMTAGDAVQANGHDKDHRRGVQMGVDSAEHVGVGFRAKLEGVVQQPGARKRAETEDSSAVGRRDREFLERELSCDGKQPVLKRDVRDEDSCLRRLPKDDQETLRVPRPTKPRVSTREEMPRGYSQTVVKRELGEKALRNHSAAEKELGRAGIVDSICIIDGKDDRFINALHSRKLTKKRRKPKDKQRSSRENGVSQTGQVRGWKTGDRSGSGRANGCATLGAEGARPPTVVANPMRWQGDGPCDIDGDGDGNDDGGNSESKPRVTLSSPKNGWRGEAFSNGRLPRVGEKQKVGLAKTASEVVDLKAGSAAGTDRRNERCPKSPLASARTTPARKSPTRSGRVGRSRRGGSVSSVAALSTITYVKHDRSTQDDYDDALGFPSPGLRGGDPPFAAGNGPTPFPRRKKRPRPKVEGGREGVEGSARALVWGESCPACRERALPVVKGEDIEEALTDAIARRVGWPCKGAEGQGGSLHGHVKVGQYVYLRNAPADEVQRSLTSEGEFATPRLGGLYGADLAGARIRVWREGGGTGGSKVGRASSDGASHAIGWRDGDGPSGLFAEADVVKFDPVAGKHRVRFVEDGSVEDLRLVEPGGSQSEGRDRVSSSGGVRWLQRCSRARARDAIRRNLSALCKGPSGEMGGLVGDEHDPPAQRRENWRWIMSRWRWVVGERDSDGIAGGSAQEGAPGGCDDDICKIAGVPPDGDGMFPPIGKVLAVERCNIDTGEKTGDGATGAEEGRASEMFLKVARLWYPQDTLRGMDPFVHGKAEVFEACRVTSRDAGQNTGERNFRDAGGCVFGPNPIPELSPAAIKIEEGNLGPPPCTPDHPPQHRSLARGDVASATPSSVVATAAALRLNAERPVNPALRLEPVVMWVRACEAWRPVNVHRCLDGRLNPSAGNVANDPLQPQTEFFLSHRYCLELDAYFPLESPKTYVQCPVAEGCADVGNARTCPDVGMPSGERVAAGGSGSDADGEGVQDGKDIGGGHPSPRSTKPRLLKRELSNGAFGLPPKGHPVKKRMSLEKASPAAVAGHAVVATPGGRGLKAGERDPTVIGWQSATRRRCSHDDTAAATAATNPVPPWGLVSPGSEGASTRSARPKPDPEQFFLCHRCRHLLPSRRLRECIGMGCGKRFCLSCRTAKRYAAPCGSDTRLAVRRTGDNLSGSGAPGVTDDEIKMESSTLVPWTGPCCRGLCGCVECGAGAESGLIASWEARNGLPSMATAGGIGVNGGERVLAATGRCRGWREPRAAKSKQSEEVGWCGWQGAWHKAKTEPVYGDNVERIRRIDAEQARGQESDDGGEKNDFHNDVGAKAAMIKWCRSCGGPGPRSSLTRCYYCRRGVHTDGCRDFEEFLTRKRLDEYGIGAEGRLVTPPRKEGAVGHGVAVCVRGRWRAGLVLCWSSILRAHYLRYIDAARENRESILDVDAIPWDGEWVVLSAFGVREDKNAQRPAFVAEASAVRWTLLEVALRLFPPRDGGGSAQIATAAKAGATVAADTGARASGIASKPLRHPSESKPATRVLRGLLKQRFKASQATAAECKMGDVAKYRPPAIVLPSSISDVGGGNNGVGCLSGSGGERPKAKVPPWLCLRCTEGKLRRLQRRVRSQFQVPREEADIEVEVGEIPSQTFSSAPAARKATDSTAPTVAAAVPPAKAIDRDRVSPVAGWMQPANPGRNLPPHHVGEINGLVKGAGRGGERPSGVSSSVASSQNSAANGDARSEGHSSIVQGDFGAGGSSVGVTVRKVAESADVDADLDASAAMGEDRRYEDLRRAHGDHRLRWLPVGNDSQGPRPFAYEAGFLSDLTDVHAHGGVTASGARISASRGSLRGKKRPGAPAVSRAFAHLLGGLDAQRPLAFALPLEITRLDQDVATFFSERDVGDEEDCESAGLVEDALRSVRSVVILDGTATVGGMGGGTAAAQLPEGKPSLGNGMEFPRITSDGMEGSSTLVRVPEAFYMVKELDLTSSARIRPLAGDKQRKLRSSSSGGGVRGASRAYRMSTTETSSLPEDDFAVASSAAALATAAIAAASGGVASGTGATDRSLAISTTTLKDVSRKDRMQRMDQRRMRRQGQELVDAGLLNLDVLQSRRKKLRFGRSTVHAWGVFADEPIAAGDLVIEYRGEIIRNAVADKREKLYEEMQIGSDYMFRVDEDTVIDATFKGSLARFINHSCDPSCTTRIIAVEGSKKIVIYAERDIAMGEELFYDYKFPLEADESARVPCRCGSEKCRGFIN